METEDNGIQVMSYNILYDSPKWGSDDAWSKREPLVAELLLRHAPDIVGLQEVLPSQLRDLSRALDGSHGYIGNAPGMAAHEEYPWLMNPGFFRLDRFRLCETGVLWLAEMDDHGAPRLGWPSYGCETLRYHYAPWLKLLDRCFHRGLWVVNVHLPQQQEARVYSTQLVTQFVRRLPPSSPVIVLGDMNTSEGPAIEVLRAGGLANARTVTQARPEGPVSTKVHSPSQSLDGRVLDHLFVSDELRVHRFRTVEERVGHRYPSDHLPIQASVCFR